MAVEIERKFLVNGKGWRELCKKSERLKDGLLAVTDEGVNVRVRLYEGRATLTVKSRGEGAKNAEFEYDIPINDAHELIDCHCGSYVLTKTRHYVPYRGFTWHVDVYDGVLEGVTIAEVEIDSLDTEVPSPPWIGREVTTDQDCHKINMLRKRLAQLRTEQISAAHLRHF